MISKNRGASKKWVYRGAPGGFTLLEVMLAIAILAVSLLAVFNLQSTSLLGSARAEKIATATRLAQAKMSQVLLEIETGMVKGEFPDEKNETGTFEDEGSPDMGWELVIRKSEIPPPPMESGKAEIFSQVFSIVSEQLSKSTREVTLKVYWIDMEEPEEMISVSTHVVKMQ